MNEAGCFFSSFTLTSASVWLRMRDRHLHPLWHHISLPHHLHIQSVSKLSGYWCSQLYPASVPPMHSINKLLVPGIALTWQFPQVVHDISHFLSKQWEVCLCFQLTCCMCCAPVVVMVCSESSVSSMMVQQQQESVECLSLSIVYGAWAWRDVRLAQDKLCVYTFFRLTEELWMFSIWSSSCRCYFALFSDFRVCWSVPSSWQFRSSEIQAHSLNTFLTTAEYKTLQFITVYGHGFSYWVLGMHGLFLNLDICCLTKTEIQAGCLCFGMFLWLRCWIIFGDGTLHLFPFVVSMKPIAPECFIVLKKA